MPDRLRTLGLLDTTLLWTNLGISLLVLVLPAYFDLPLRDALAATLVGAVIGNAMLATAALIGADARVPTMVLQRAPLGRRGSYLATGLNILQCLGWAIFELIVIATAAGLLCDKLFGFEVVWLWKLVFGGLAAMLALLGPVGFVRRFVKKFAIWAVLASVVYLAWWILDGANLGNMWTEGGHKGSFWIAVDTVVAVTVSWAPLVADYTRFSRDRRSAFFGVGIGYLLPTLFQFGFGSILVLSRGVDPSHPELILVAIAGGGAAAALALLALTVDETDEAFANVYSAAVSTQNLVHACRNAPSIVGASVIATVGALAIDMRSYQRFLLLLGAVFVPLLGVLRRRLAARRGAHYTREHVFAGPPSGRARSSPGRPASSSTSGSPSPQTSGFWSRWIAELPTPEYQIGASHPELRHRLPADGDRGEARLGACRSSRSSGTSRATALAAARRASAALRTTPRARGGARPPRDDRHALRAGGARGIRAAPRRSSASRSCCCRERRRPRSHSSTKGDKRTMIVDHPGDSWSPKDAKAVPRGAWVHVAPLLRSEFPAETIAALARGRRISFDGQGLVRSASGTAQLDADFDPALLEHVQILKFAEEEAEVVGAVDKLGVPEVLVTYGARGSCVLRGGTDRRRRMADHGRPNRLRRRLFGRVPRRQVPGSDPGCSGQTGHDLVPHS